MKRALKTLVTATLVAAVLATALTVPASAELAKVTVRMPDGTLQALTLDVPAGASLQDIGSLIPAGGEPVAMEVVARGETAPDAVAPAPPTAPDATTPTETTPAPLLEEDPPTTTPLDELEPGEGLLEEPRRRPGRRRELRVELPPRDRADRKARHRGENRPRRRSAPPRLRSGDGSPAPGNPSAVTALPGAASPFTTGVPNFVIEKFRVPVFLLPIYQAAGIEYGIRWEILAAINEIETDYGRNLNVSSAGALGWMQFMPASWRAYGVDANKDGKKDPYNPVDAIFAAARYLAAANYEEDVRGAIFAYNHADWYVDSVLLRAKLIAGVPADLVGSLTGLTEGRFPVAAKARYADDLQEARSRRVQAGENAANVIESDANRRSVEIYAKKGSPAVATNDGIVKRVDRANGRVVLQDVYGNTYTYNGLGSIARLHAVPKEGTPADPETSASALAANPVAATDDEDEPAAPASAGRQPAEDDGQPTRGDRGADRSAGQGEDTTQPQVATKRRLFAHPEMPGARESGGLEQALDAKVRSGEGLETYRNQFARPFGVDAKDVSLRRLKKGSRVIAGTVLGRLGVTEAGKASHLEFQIRPAGKGAPTIDPKPILDGWKLLEATAIYRASGRNVLHGEGNGFSIGQVLLLPKGLLERRVLSDERIEIYEGGRSDIRSGQIDRRVLATMAYLAESGMRPTITSLKAGHGFLTASGNVSHHSSGNALDIAAINGTPILGHQDPGGITEQAVRRLMALQGTMQPSQIISLLDLGANTMPLSDHADHIHVGFAPRFGDNPRLGRQALAVLKPGQWSDLLDQLGDIENPVVPTSPSEYSLPADE